MREVRGSDRTEPESAAPHAGEEMPADAVAPAPGRTARASGGAGEARAWLGWVREVVVRPSVVLFAMVALYVEVFGRLTWLQQSNYGTFGFDMGIFDQEIWLASHFKSTFITVRGLNMWANHVNPIVYLLAPFYWLGAGPHFLYLLQTIALAAGAVPLWLLARDRFGDGWLALGIPAAWLLYPSVEWMTWWHFHPESLGVAPILFGYWFATRRRWWWYALCVVLVLAVKEDAALPVMALGLVVALRMERRAGLATIGGALAWFVLCVAVIIPHATGGAPFYASQFPALGNSTGQIVFNAIRHPSRVLHLVLAPDRHDYYRRMLLPVAAVALLAPVVLLIAVPTALVNVLNDQGYTHNFMYQYQAFVSAGIFLATVEAIGRMHRVATRRFLVGLVCACALATNAVWSPSPIDARTYHSGIWSLTATAHTRAMDEIVHAVPANAAVSASYTAVPHLTHRTEIYEWPNPWIRDYYGVSATSPPEDPARIQYLVIDTGLNAETDKLLAKLTAPGGQFRILFDQDGALLAKRVPAPRKG